jgi:hypothetical protein
MLDIRIPIGMMFTIFGAILLILGLISRPEDYQAHSGNININLYWGGAMLVFGVLMLLFARFRRQN